jgi:hypothetical protein
LGTPHAYVQSHYQIGYDDGCAGNVVPGPIHLIIKGIMLMDNPLVLGVAVVVAAAMLYNNHYKITLAPLLPLIGLTVNINNLNFGESSIGVNIKEPFVDTKYCIYTKYSLVPLLFTSSMISFNSFSLLIKRLFPASPLLP